ncbi:MAG: 50S ribosomal protein L24 [Candidatus Zixiibacteriota bacterium]
MWIKKGDSVLVIAGDDRGKIGKVLKVFPNKNRAIVESVNFIKRHTKQTRRAQKGGIIEKEAPVNLSNLLVFCSKCSSPTKVSFKVLEGEAGEKSSKVRICRKCGEII